MSCSARLFRRLPRRPRAVLATAAALALVVSGIAGWLGSPTRAAPAPSELAQGLKALASHQEANRAATKQILEVLADGANDDPFTRAMALSRAVSTEQATLLGIELVPPPPSEGGPSEAAMALLERHEVVPTPDQRKAIASLEDRPDAQAGALARVIYAFSGFEDAASAAFAMVTQSCSSS